MRFTVSIGVSAPSSIDYNLDALLSQADDALYRAKHTGRNKVCVDLNYRQNSDLLHG